MASAQSWSLYNMDLAVQYICLSVSRISVPNCSFVTFAPPFLVGSPAGSFCLHRLDGEVRKISRSGFLFLSHMKKNCEILLGISQFLSFILSHTENLPGSLLYSYLPESLPSSQLYISHFLFFDMWCWFSYDPHRDDFSDSQTLSASDIFPDHPEGYFPDFPELSTILTVFPYCPGFFSFLCSLHFLPSSVHGNCLPSDWCEGS